MPRSPRCPAQPSSAHRDIRPDDDLGVCGATTLPSLAGPLPMRIISNLCISSPHNPRLVFALFAHSTPRNLANTLSQPLAQFPRGCVTNRHGILPPGSSFLRHNSRSRMVFLLSSNCRQSLAPNWNVHLRSQLVTGSFCFMQPCHLLPILGHPSPSQGTKQPVLLNGSSLLGRTRKNPTACTPWDTCTDLIVKNTSCVPSAECADGTTSAAACQTSSFPEPFIKASIPRLATLGPACNSHRWAFGMEICGLRLMFR